ncbi:MAG: hypothetical protein FPO08_07600 [Geobacter sp.]|nr:MAG: hypothetical protein FPO08_07600 [Geobacter sp.]
MGDLTLSSKSVGLSDAILYLYFPKNAADTVCQIVLDPRLARDDRALHISEAEYEEDLPLSLELPYVFMDWSDTMDDGKTILTDIETMNLLWKVLPRELARVSAVFKAYAKLAGRWHDVTTVNLFLDTMGDILTGEPRYRQVSRIFYETTIKKAHLKVMITDEGPYIYYTPYHSAPGGMPMDRAEIIFLEEPIPNLDRVIEPGYYIAKYGGHGEARIHLSDFTSRDFQQLSRELGATPITGGRRGYSIFDFSNFTKSEAFDELKKWVVSNPRFATEIASHPWTDLARKPN